MKKLIFTLIMGTFLAGPATQAGTVLNTKNISVLSGEKALTALKGAYGKKLALQDLLREQGRRLKNASASDKPQAQSQLDTLKGNFDANQNLIAELEKRMASLNMVNQMNAAKRESLLQAKNLSGIHFTVVDPNTEATTLKTTPIPPLATKDSNVNPKAGAATTTSTIPMANLKDIEEKSVPSSSAKIGLVSAPNSDQAGNQASVEENLNAFKENYYKVLRLRKLIDEQNKIIRSSTTLIGHKEKAQAQVDKILKPFKDAKAQLTALNLRLRSWNQGDKIAQIKTDVRNKLGLTSTSALKTEEQSAVTSTMETSSQPAIAMAGPDASIAKREGLLSRAERRALRKNAKKDEKVNDEDAALMSVRDLYGNTEDF